MLHFPEKDLLLTAIRASTDATLKIVILVLLGVYATTKGTQSLTLEESSPNGEYKPYCFMIAGIFNERGISDLGRLVYHISLPALVFSNILTEVGKILHSKTLLLSTRISICQPALHGINGGRSL